MRREIRFFHQHTFEATEETKIKVEQNETCGIACVLMIFDLYNRVSYPTKKMELELYKDYRSKAYKMGTLGSSLADCLSQNELKVCMMHSSPGVLDNKGQYFEPELFDAILTEWKEKMEKCKKSVEILTGISVTCDTIKEQIVCGRQVILLCLIDGNVDGIHDKSLHWIVVYGYEENKFLICDPSACKRKYSEEELWEYMDTPLGQICITVEEGRSL